MTPPPSSNTDRDLEDNAKARAWARSARQKAEAGRVQDDSHFLERKLAEERSRLASRDLRDRYR